MNKRKILFLSFAVIIGLGTLLLMRSAMHKPAKSADANTAEILVAASDIPAGQFIQPQNVRWQPWAKKHVTEAFIRKDVKAASGKSADPAGAFVGAVARQGIRAGEPVLAGGIVKPQDRGFLSAVLNPGMRAVAAPITNVTGIAGFVFPGDRVDLILTHMIRDDESGKAVQRRGSATIAENVRVLALDQNANDQDTTKPKVAKVVTLEVDPKEAEKVTLALQLGTLSLSLRSLAEENKNDVKLIGYNASGMTLDSDVSNLIPPPRAKISISNQVVQVLRGKTRDSASFTDTPNLSNNNANIDETR